MKKSFRFMPLAFLVICLFSVPSFGWFAPGHMAVAYVAYQNLSQEAKDRVDVLLRLNPDYNQWRAGLPTSLTEDEKRMMCFMIAATWPDIIKDRPGYKDDGSQGGNVPDGKSSWRNIGYSDRLIHKYWHFVDLPFTQDGTKLEQPPKPNALTQIATFRKVLASDKSDALKSYDLVWLLHIVGDVHQPLHCTQRFGKTQPHGDAGGNFVKLSAAPGKLHLFWDGLPGDGDSPFIAIFYGQALAKADPALAGISDAEVWINESFELAKTKVYVDPIGLGAGPFTLDDAYKSAAMDVAKVRVALGGARLANILNLELK